MARALCFLLAIVLLPTSRLPAQDVPLSLDLEEVYRVGGVNAPEWGQFGFAGFVSFDGSGNLYILEPSRPLVTVLNTRGGLLRIIGREGEGPGEFVSPSKLLVWRDGRVAVLDSRKECLRGLRFGWCLPEIRSVRWHWHDRRPEPHHE